MSQDSQRTAVIATFDSRAGAEVALVALSQEGVDMKRLSIVGQDFGAEQDASESFEPEEFFVLVYGTVEMIVHARAVLGMASSEQSSSLRASESAKHEMAFTSRLP